MIPLKQIYAVQKLVMEPDIKIPNPTYVTQIPRSASVLKGLPLLSFDTKLLPAGSATLQPLVAPVIFTRRYSTLPVTPMMVY